MKKLIQICCMVSVLFAFSGNVAAGERQSSGIITQLQELHQQLQMLQAQYGLTESQQEEMRTVFFSAMPTAARLTESLLDNRQDLLDHTAGKDSFDEDYVRQVADNQGQLIADLIVWKETLKKDLRSVLDEDQKALVDDMIAAFLEWRLQQLSG